VVCGELMRPESVRSFTVRSALSVGSRQLLVRSDPAIFPLSPLNPATIDERRTRINNGRLTTDDRQLTTDN